MSQYTFLLSTANQVAQFLAAAKGWRIEIRESIVTIEKRFTSGDMAAYVDCDVEAGSILSLAPLRGGSVWGTDSGSIGCHVGRKNGYYRLNKSGTGKRFLKALEKAINA